MSLLFNYGSAFLNSFVAVSNKALEGANVVGENDKVDVSKKNLLEQMEKITSINKIFVNLIANNEEKTLPKDSSKIK